MDRLGPLDVWFLDVEDGHDHMHIGSVAVLDGPAPSHDEVVAAIQSQLPRVPRYRQRAEIVPSVLGRPVWVDAPDVDLRYHIRRTALPAPGGDAELSTLVGRVMSQELDRSRPLWEAWVVEGLAGARWGLLSKVHHSMVDGIAGTDIMSALLDVTPDPKPVPPDDWRPRPAPALPAVALDVLRDLLGLPRAAARRFRTAIAHPVATAAQAAHAVRGVARLAGVIRPGGTTALNDRIGAHRTYAVARVRIDDVARVRERFDVTLNDVALAAVTAGFRALLAARRQTPAPRQTLRSMVPVSLRRPDERGRFDNRVSAMFCDLPVGLEEPLERLRRVHDEVSDHKQAGEADGGAALIALLGRLPQSLVEPGTRLACRAIHTVVQHSVNTVTTNVPGPSTTLYLLGRPVVEILPYVPIGEGVTVGVAIFSYRNRLTFGVTGDLGTSPDVDVLAAGIEAGFAELVAAATNAGSSTSSRICSSPC